MTIARRAPSVRSRRNPLDPIEPMEPRTLLSATLTTAVPAQAVTAGQTSSAVALGSYFDDPTIPAGDTAIDITTNLAAPDNSIPLYLTNAATPGTVANFLKYISTGEYADTIIHRSVPGFIIQGGGYTADGTMITSFGSIAGESSTATLTNTAGTIAMALSTGPNSGTSEWFFNLAANSNLDGTSDGGPFTAFGQVVYNGMTVLDDIAALPIVDDTDQGGGAWNTVPVLDNTITNGSTVATVPSADLVTLNPTVVTGGLTYTATSSNTALVTPTVSGDSLSLAGVAGASGTAEVTVTATDLAGGTATSTFAVTVAAAAPPSLTLTAAAAQTATAESAATLSLGTFAESNATAPYTVTVDWGDGSADTTFSQAAPGAITATSHTFAAAGTDTVSVTVADSAGNTSAPATFAVTVAAPAPPGLNLTAPAAQTATVGVAAAFSLGSFTAGADTTAPYAITIDWGDGSADTTLAQAAGGTIGSPSHTFTAAGTDTVSVTVADSAGHTSAASTFTVTVTGPAVAPPGLTPAVSKSTVATSAVQGTTVKGTVTLGLTNDTTTASAKGTTVVHVYAVTAAQAADPTTGTLVGTAKKGFKLAAGTSAALPVPVKAALPADTYTLIAVATDPAGNVIAATSGPTLTVAAQAVTLSATVAAAKATVAAGKPVTFTLTVTNAGNVASTGSATIVLALSADGSTATVPLGTLKRSATVKPGKAVVLHLSAKVPAGTAAVAGLVPLVTFTQTKGAATAVGTSAVDVS